MKKLLFLILGFVLFSSINAQVTLINDFFHDMSDVRLGFLPDHGIVYYGTKYEDEWTHPYFCIYDLNDKLIKKIDAVGLVGSLSDMRVDELSPTVNFKYQIGITQYLFNKDSKIEILLRGDTYCYIYNEDRQLITTMDLWDYHLINLEVDKYILYGSCGGEARRLYSIEGNPLKSHISTSKQEVKVTSNQFSVFPNPTNGVFTCKVVKDFNGDVNIVNSSGSLIKNLKYNELTTIDISSEPNGLYICNFNSKNGIKGSVKIVKK